MAIIDTVKHKWRVSTMLMRLIYVNIAVFLVIRIGAIVCMFAGVSELVWLRWFELPSMPQWLCDTPWTVVTYMFSHFDVLHILFNMLWLYWFGTVFMLTGTQKQVFALYLYGGIGGALLYLLAFNTLPAFAGQASLLIGASASVIAIVVATAVIHPEYRMGLLFIGSVSLKWIAIITLGLFMLGLTGNNAGGHVAHVGGAVVGLIYGLCFKNGRDITKPFNKLIDRMVVAFSGGVRVKRPKAKRFTKSHKKQQTETAQKQSQDKRQKDINATPEDQAALNAILDKIKKSGYSALTADEKRRLFEVSKRIK
ncbi:MAG: rhomboid family intramembrane serine protease [Muribaculaceae bacterium]|nr:rhomboid family intramembrane serine protease [Muribaculaceae bacterium]